MLWPRKAGKYIAENAGHVFIKTEGVKKCAEEIFKAAIQGKLDNAAFKQNEVLPKNLTQDQLINWTFLIDSLNFSFWTESNEDKFQVTFEDKTRAGYLAMVNAVNRTIAEGKPLYDPKFYSEMTLDQLEVVFKADNNTKMPLMQNRLEILHQVGQKLIEKFDGNFAKVLKIANRNVLKLLEILITEFPSYRDVHTYKDKQVAILKRAQILIADLAFVLEEGYFKDLDELTMFADYRVPQSLIHFGVMEYSKELTAELKQNKELCSGDPAEVEIRGVSIHATELVVEEVKKMVEKHKNERMSKGEEADNAENPELFAVEKIQINSAKVDFFLWDYRLQNANALENIPFHKTRSIFY